MYKNILTLESELQITDWMVSTLAQLIHYYIEENGFTTIALSGGNTPKNIYQVLSSQNIDWEKTYFFQVDERYVSEDNIENNYNMIYKSLFKNISIPESNIYKIDTSKSPIDLCAESYNNAISSFISANNNISFDITILGIGQDGHTASIFPQVMNTIDNTKISVSISHPEIKPARISLTLPFISKSKYIFILALGTNKTQIVDKVLNSNTKYPISYIIENAKNYKFILDKVAADSLK